MTVSVPEASTAARTLCPSCQTEMTPVEVREEEPVVAEEAEQAPLGMRLVELAADAPAARPTVVVPHGEPPKWKPTPVAQAWTTVARGLTLQRWGVLVALLQPAGTFVLLLLSWFGVVRLAPTEEGLPPAAWAVFVLTYVVVAVTGVLFVAGRLCCFRVPSRTGAYIGMAVACGGAAVATLVALLTSSEYFIPPGTPLSPLLFAGRWVAFGLWLASEWAFLWALNRVGHFVKRPGLVLLTGMTGVALPLVVGLGVASDLSGDSRFVPVLEAAFAGLFVLYLILLQTARSAVQMKTPEESSDARE